MNNDIAQLRTTVKNKVRTNTHLPVMAGLVPAIHVFNPCPSRSLILRSRRSLRLEGGSKEHRTILRDGHCVTSSG